MKTNYDHIIEGGIEALADVVANHTCQSCSFQSDCKKEWPIPEMCFDGVMEWLNQPYIEPDTQERTDSVEQVTMEMWQDLGRSIKYADRLRALGVEVRQ